MLRHVTKCYVSAKFRPQSVFKSRRGAQTIAVEILNNDVRSRKRFIDITSVTCLAVSLGRSTDAIARQRPVGRVYSSIITVNILVYFHKNILLKRKSLVLLDPPGELLAGLKPVAAIERGQLDLVWQVAEGPRTGSLL